MEENKYFVTIDPGSEGTGIAFFNGKLHPKATQSISSDKIMWRDKCDDIMYRIEAFLLKWAKENSVIVYCESPQFFETARGLTAARSDALAKLTTLYGRIWQLTRHLACPFQPLDIGKWKGQLNKQQTEQRVFKILAQTYKTSHETDAVAMGLFLKGIF